MDNKSIIEELKALKVLVDNGGITKEEFEERKKLLLETSEEKSIRLAEEEKANKYESLIAKMEKAQGKEFNDLARGFAELSGYKEANDKKDYCEDKYLDYVVDEKYKRADKLINNNTIECLNEAVKLLEEIKDKREVEDVLEKTKIDLDNLIEEKKKRDAAEAVAKSKKRKKRIIITIIIVILIGIACVLYKSVYIPAKIKLDNYNAAITKYEAGDFIESSYDFNNMLDYKDSSDYKEKSCNALYALVSSNLENSNWNEINSLSSDIYNVKKEYVLDEVESNIKKIVNDKLAELVSSNEDNLVVTYFEEINKNLFNENADEFYKNSASKIANTFFEEKNYEEAATYYGKAGMFTERGDCYYQIGLDYQKIKYYTEAIQAFTNAGRSNYANDANKRIKECKYGQIIMSYNYDGDLNSTERNYIKELYKDSAYKNRIINIYNKVFAWKVEVYAVNTSEYSDKWMDSISRNSNVYWHVRVSGGDGGTIRLKYSMLLPGTNWLNDEWNYDLRAGDKTWCGEYYTTGGQSGTAYINIYNKATGALMTSASTWIY